MLPILVLELVLENRQEAFKEVASLKAMQARVEARREEVNIEVEAIG